MRPCVLRARPIWLMLWCGRAGFCAVEQTADAAEQTLRNEEREEGQFLTGRFSPGYGDYPIAVQNDLLRLLDAPRKIGCAPLRRIC